VVKPPAPSGHPDAQAERDHEARRLHRNKLSARRKTRLRHRRRFGAAITDPITLSRRAVGRLVRLGYMPAGGDKRALTDAVKALLEGADL
jgi:hypothetical protein